MEAHGPFWYSLQPKKKNKTFLLFSRVIKKKTDNTEKTVTETIASHKTKVFILWLFTEKFLGPTVW